MERRTMEAHADRIEMLLASHRVPSRVSGGTVTPRCMRFLLAPILGSKLSSVKALSEEIAMALDAPSCRVFRQRGNIAIDIPRPDPEGLSLSQVSSRLTRVPPCCVVLGVEESGTPILIRLSSPDVTHVLIAGTTGSGKTALARTMIASLAMYNRLGEVQLVLIDPKRTGFRAFCQLPHLLRPVISSVECIQQQMLDLLKQMERRDTEGIRTPRIVVFFDELGDTILAGGKHMQQAVTRLAQRGRSAGIHLVACTQKPTAAVIGSLVKANLPVRLVGRVTCAEEASVATGLPATGAEKLTGRGDFLLVAGGEVIRIQAAHISEPAIRRLTGGLRIDGRTSRRTRLDAAALGRSCREPGNGFRAGPPPSAVEHVQVLVSVQGRERGRLEVKLYSPAGTEATLLSRRSGDHRANIVGVVTLKLLV